MQIFELFIDDGRRPSNLSIAVLAKDVLQAVDRAQQVLELSSHHRGVEVFKGGVRLFGLGSMSLPVVSDALLRATRQDP